MAMSVRPDERPPGSVAALAARVEEDGGRALAVYREPVGGHWQIFVLLPIDKVAPTPYQRDLSPTHAKRLQEMVKKIDRFVDPIVVDLLDHLLQPLGVGGREVALEIGRAHV